jgi:hypothetical protein
MASRAKVLAVVLLALVILPAVLSACPLCKDALEDRTTGLTSDLGRGFYYSILLMVSAPFLVLGGLFLRIYRMRRRQRLEGAIETETAPAPRLVPDPRGARS